MILVFADNDGTRDPSGHFKSKYGSIIVKMGASESSMLAVEERESCFKRGPELSTDLYRLDYILFIDQSK